MAAAWASTPAAPSSTPQPPTGPATSFRQAPAVGLRPSCFHNPNGGCGTWEYFSTGQYCVSIYPNNPQGACENLALYDQQNLNDGVGGTVLGCIGSVLGTGIWVEAVVGGELTLGAVVFSCTTGGLWAYVS
ncbi:MAG: hypothetical protein ACYCYA_05995 [Actinomycetes bacterium]